MPTQDSATPDAVSDICTHPTEFLACSHTGQMLFAVQGGIGADEATSRASSYLGAAIEILEKETQLSEAGHGAIVLLRMAKAIFNALRLDEVKR